MWRLLRRAQDPTLRSYLVHEIPTRLADAAPIVRQLEQERDASIRGALILMLGHLSDQQIGADMRRRVTSLLLQLYRDDPDAGVHGAIDWVLRHAKRGAARRPIDWSARARLMEIDSALAGQPATQRDWFVTPEGHTLSLVRGPVSFEMGSPLHEEGRVPSRDSPDEPRHTVHIVRSFAIGTKEVTVAQFRRFLQANPEVAAGHTYRDRPGQMERNMTRLSPDDDGPQIAVTWYEAAMYCNWLSMREGIPESEWVYPVNPRDIKGGMKLPADYLRRTGYRLPTEAEWEFAARAGSVTPRFFGREMSLLKEYAWYAARPQKSKDDPMDPGDPSRTWPGGQLEPNDLGLFDVYGNVWEWTQNRIDLTIDANGSRVDNEDTDLTVTDTVARPRRGGAFMYEAAFMRSANRGTVGAHPITRRDNVGFRLARTLQNQ